MKKYFLLFVMVLFISLGLNAQTLTVDAGSSF